MVIGRLECEILSERKKRDPSVGVCGCVWFCGAWLGRVGGVWVFVGWGVCGVGVCWGVWGECWGVWAVECVVAVGERKYHLPLYYPDTLVNSFESCSPE